MKDILKLMRFDFLTAVSPTQSTSYYILTVFMLIVFVGFSLFIFPASSAVYLFFAGPLIIPLQSYAEKSGFNKLYGILPVRRKNITRARFLYIFFTHFCMELASLLVMMISFNAKLYRLLPETSRLLVGDDGMMSPESICDFIGVMLVFFAFACLMFVIMEMYGQIHGRQNEMKLLFIIIGAVCVIVLGGVFILGQLGYPELKVDLPVWASLPIVNLGVLGLCVLFGEVTAAKLAKREL